MFRFFFLLLILLILPDLFIWWNFTREQSIWRTVLVVLPTVIALACMILLMCHVRASLLMQWAFILIICVSVPKAVFMVTWFVGRGIIWHNEAALPMLRTVSLTLAVLMAALQVYGTGWGWKHLQVQRNHLRVRQLPSAFNGYKIVQISDLHLGTYAGDTSLMQALVDSVNRENPDLIVFTGDLVNMASAEAVPFVQTLKKLRATDGVYSVLGNHDYCMYQPGLTPAQLKAEVQRIVRIQRAMGWNVLLDAHHPIVRGADTLYVAGVENIGKRPFTSQGNLSKAIEGIPKNACTILLSHDPWHWRHGVIGQNVALTLSGHTHGLQMQIGRFSPAAWFMPEWGGLYREKNQQLFVSIGVGGGVPYRLGAWPKIELLTLHN